jgi:LysR family transcriptional regulator, glycine cleavage system transcriptional activator
MTPKFPSLTVLRHLETVCRLGSVTRAAKSLGVSHAAISQSISLLERRLGPMLARRPMSGGAEMKATAAAMVLIAGYRRASEALNSAVEAAINQPEMSSFRIRADQSFADGWLSPNLKAMFDLFPSLAIAGSESLGAVNAVISRAELSHRFDAHVDLFRDVLVPVCTPGLKADLDLEAAADLVRARLICGVPTYWRWWIEAAGLEPYHPIRTIELSQQSLRVRSAIDGLGVALINPMFVLPELERGDLVPACPGSLPRPAPYRIYWRREDVFAEGAARLACWMFQAVREPIPAIASAAWRATLFDTEPDARDGQTRGPDDSIPCGPDFNPAPH